MELSTIHELAVSITDVELGDECQNNCARVQMAIENPKKKLGNNFRTWAWTSGKKKKHMP